MVAISLCRCSVALAIVSQHKADRIPVRDGRRVEVATEGAPLLMIEHGLTVGRLGLQRRDGVALDHAPEGCDLLKGEVVKGACGAIHGPSTSHHRRVA